MARIFNGGTVPLVVRWGEGVIGPGESIEVDNPDSFGAPWTTDPETEAADTQAAEQDRKHPARSAAPRNDEQSEED